MLIVKEEKWLTDCIIRITDIGVPEYKEEDREMFI